MFDNNRITNAITRQKAAIAKRLADGLVTQNALNQLHQTLDMTTGEFIRLQELKSLATAQNLLTVEEGMVVYNLLGNSPTVFNAQPLEVKVVLTQLFQELLQRRLNRRAQSGKSEISD